MLTKRVRETDVNYGGGGGAAPHQAPVRLRHHTRFESHTQSRNGAELDAT